MKKILRLVAISVMALSFTTGIAAANSADIDTTGPDSTNKIEFDSHNSADVDNNNNLSVSNNNDQEAFSGNAKVKHNTTGGDATSGDASNDSLQSVAASVDNSGSSSAALGGGCGCGDNDASISNTGPDSYNKVEVSQSSHVDVENNNNVSVSNNNSQSAFSGHATVWGNTTGGDATSGSASNISSQTTTLTITN